MKPPDPSQGIQATQADLDRLLDDTDICKSRIILTAVDLQVFSHLGQSGKALSVLARDIQIEATMLERLLNALAEIGYLVRKQDGAYENSALSDTFLNKESQHYIGSWIRLNSLEWFMWGELTATLKGQGNRQEHCVFDDQERLTALIQGAHERAMLAHVGGILDAVDLSHCRTLLDVGSGLGTYAIAFAQHWPNLKCTLIDRPLVVDMAEALIHQNGLSERITCIAADYLSVDFVGPYDACFMSNVLHAETEEHARQLICKAQANLSPGGQLIIRDYFLSEEGTSSLHGAMFSLAILMETGDGRSWKCSEVTSMCEQSGLTMAAQTDSLLVFRKPT
jgi:predicted O-methyltransferase YrrM